MKGSYEIRVKASVVQYNTSRVLSSVCRTVNNEVPTQTEIIQNKYIPIKKTL